jgi:transposase
VIGAGAELHLLHRGFEWIGAGLIQRIELADLAQPHNKIKLFRCIFSRFDKLTTRYLGFLNLVGALIWLR